MKRDGQMEIFTRFAEAYDTLKADEISLQDYLLGCREDPQDHDDDEQLDEREAVLFPYAREPGHW